MRCPGIQAAPPNSDDQFAFFRVAFFFLAFFLPAFFREAFLNPNAFLPAFFLVAFFFLGMPSSLWFVDYANSLRGNCSIQFCARISRESIRIRPEELRGRLRAR